MTIFIDSANLDHVRAAYAMGIVKGVTTNQSIFLKSGIKYSEETHMHNIRKICEIVNHRPVSVELTKIDCLIEDLVDEAEQLWDIDRESIVIKVPMWGNGKGLRVLKELHDLGIPTNATCLMSPIQAIIAAEAGADYVSLFYNRILDNFGGDQTHLENYFIGVRNYIDEHHCDSKIIAGSIHKPSDVSTAFSAGADIVTVPYDVFTKLPYHERTESTIKEFDDAWKKFTSG